MDCSRESDAVRPIVRLRDNQAWERHFSVAYFSGNKCVECGLIIFFSTA